MARKPRESSIENHTDALPEETMGAIAQDMAASAQLPALQAEVSEHQGVILAQYGDGLPYERLRYVDKCRYHMARSAEEALEVGRCLIVMKECEGHGDWLPLLDDIGLGLRTAQKMMQATVRFSNASSTTHLLEAAKSKTKLLELMVLDDEELAQLNDGESVRGLQLDDVERMSVSELRRALRQTRADKEAEVAQAKSSVSGELAAKDRIIADSKKRIAELVEEKSQRECMTDGERHGELEEALTQRTLTAVGALAPVRQAIDSIRGLESCPQGLYVASQAALHRIITEAESIAAEYGISLDFGIAAGGDDYDDPNAGEEFGEGPQVVAE